MGILSYADAVKFLGGKENEKVAALDRILGGALLAGSGLGIGALLGWFDAKVEFVRLSHELVRKVAERRSGISRYDRTQRLHAAHTVIVMVAFFEAFDESGIPLTGKDLDLTRRRQLEITHLHDAAVPLPSPEQPYEDHLKALREWYRDLGSDLVTLAEGLAVWDGLNDTVRARIRDSVRTDVPKSAERRYQELFRQLAVDCPEVAFWWALQDAEATRAEVRSVGTALSQLERTLTTLAVGERSADRQRTALAFKYQAELDYPIIEPDEDQNALYAPSLRDSYVDPRFQVCEAGAGATFTSVSWWDAKPVRNDVHRFLAGYLTSPKATSRPMLVLGDPGSGKSVLTKVLAARLPISDFLVLRVVLRTVPTEATILDQIEHGLRAAVQEQVSWPALTASAGQALPVVLLDGFDELLQATGVSQTDYLRNIARFQQESAALGRPVAVVVTSRISVADRASVPDGSVVLRLVPFADSQIERWLTAWRKANKPYFQAQNLKPLRFEHVQRYSDLSEQPLLLLMLALYDADSNALQRETETISHADLYERLLTRFADREVRKDGDHRTVEDLAEATETELERLSIVAFAMFNRGAQWVTEQDLDRDLAALLPVASARGGLRAPLGAGETVLGRFFFVQRSQAERDRRTLSTYEFLHATFGEYLVARSTWRILADLVELERNRPRGRFAGEIDDSSLYAFLSFAALCGRAPIVGFLTDMAAVAHEDERQRIGDLAARLFQAVGEQRQNQRLGEYEPVALPILVRYAVYSQNLVLLAVVVRTEMTGTELFGDDVENGRVWQSWAQLWQSQLTSSDWTAVVDTLRVDRVWTDDDRRDVVISLADGNTGVPLVDFQWIMGRRTPAGRYTVSYGDRVGQLSSEAYFSCSEYGDVVNYAIAPIDRYLPNVGWEIARMDSGRWAAGIGSLIDRFFAGSADWAFRRELLDLRQAVLDTPEGLLFEALLFDAVNARFDAYDLSDFEGSELAGRVRFWEIMCDRLGKGGDDDGLLSLLCRNWSTGLAFRSIPEAVLDAWLRMTERSAPITSPAPSLLTVLDGIDLERVERVRPDLIKRARAAMAEIGQSDTITWPR